MSVTLHFEPPTIYNADMWIIGQGTGLSDTLTEVSSGTTVGDYPEYINTLR